MEIKWNLVMNVFLAMFIYNLFLKTISDAILKRVFGDKTKEAVKKSFKEHIEEALNEQHKTKEDV